MAGESCLAPCTPTNGSVSILLANGDGTFQPHVDYEAGLIPPGLTIGDLNGDGKLDVAVANSHSDTISVFTGKGDGTFRPRTDYTTGAGPYAATSRETAGFARPLLTMGAPPFPLC